MTAGGVGHHRLDGDLDLRQRPDHHPDLERDGDHQRVDHHRPERQLQRQPGAGGSPTFGFLGSWNSTNAAPTVSCTAS